MVGALIQNKCVNDFALNNNNRYKILLWKINIRCYYLQKSQDKSDRVKDYDQTIQWLYLTTLNYSQMIRPELTRISREMIHYKSLSPKLGNQNVINSNSKIMEINQNSQISINNSVNRVMVNNNNSLNLDNKILILVLILSNKVDTTIKVILLQITQIILSNKEATAIKAILITQIILSNKEATTIKVKLIQILGT